MTTMTLEMRKLQNCQEELRMARDEIHNLKNENVRLRYAILTTIDELGHLADGENCSLIVLKRAIEYSKRAAD